MQHWYFLLLAWGLFHLTFGAKSSGVKDQISNTGLLVDADDDTLLVSTLNGALHAINKNSGTRKWTLNEDAIIKNPSDSGQSGMPRFFPNPQDGSLYRYTLGRGREPLKKLPFTIPELVSNSPCRSSDGIFYLGKKVDSWLGIDSITGKKQLVLGVDSVERVCPKPSSHTVYLGRTLYNIILYDPNSGNKWNVSFYHYSTNNTPLVNKYDLVHYTGTGEGSILTVDQQSGDILWKIDLHSPVIAMYLLGHDGTLTSVPLTAVAPQTLEHFTYDLAHNSHFNIPPGSEALLVKKLSPTIYLGQSKDGVYALPALVDEDTITISRKDSQLLLEGPPGSQATMDTGSREPNPSVENSDLIVLGYYDLPESLKSELNKLSPKEIEGLGFSEIPLGISYNNNGSSVNIQIASAHDTDEMEAQYFSGFHKFIEANMTFVLSREFVHWGFTLVRLSITWPFLQPINFIVVLLTAILFFIVILLYRQAQEYARLSQEVSSRRLGSSGSTGSNSGGNITAVAEELDNGDIKIGKMVFNPKDILGKGCDGTFVFRGAFDGRSVAVKRVLPGCFSIADREVDLLRESDQHPHVIRYFCMEQCREFRYIALELCAATLEDFVLGKFEAKISPTALLHQATSGLHHLHSLGIVHRDIKPHNVLLSLPNSKGDVRGMISDFGLCRRLEYGHMSFSKKSGITGTEGWIAPEMMDSARPTTKIDIFSMGCVYYYVLSKGKHPFGRVLDRQSSILSGNYKLDALDKESDVLSYSLIEKMIHAKPYERPPTSALMRHPIFWTNDFILQFFSDVSDRLEMENSNSLLVMNLEWGALNIVKGDWRAHMHPCIAEDLRKFREYKSRSVRDLLRALRNKKSHYRELPAEAQRAFGPIPDGFVPYWTRRFPKLLIHTWVMMQNCKSEASFTKYYSAGFNFKNSIHQDYNSLLFTPNNKPLHLSGTKEFNHSPERSSPEKTKAYEKENDPLDLLLGPPLAKGLRKHPKQEDNRASKPVWMAKKPQNTFEPSFKPVVAISEAQDNQDKSLEKSTCKTDSPKTRMNSDAGEVLNKAEFPETEDQPKEIEEEGKKKKKKKKKSELKT